MLVERVTDVEDRRLADYRDLRDTDHRRRGLFVVEGRFAVRQLLRSPRFATRSVLTTEPMLEGLADLLAPAPGGPPVLLAPHALIRQVVGFQFHRGCVAMGERGAPISVATLIEAAGPRLILVLEALVDPENVGAVFRNALAFGADAVLLSPGCGDPLARKAIRVSSGGTLHVAFTLVDPWPEGLVQLSAAGYEIVALAPDGVEDLAAIGHSRPVPPRLTLLLGNEGHGLSGSARAFACLTVRIAMAPGVDSLN
ncbi:MAG: TrmH family RNA methyltransferase, partial [Candidatus Rokuibacteriota bacterium]